MNKIGCYFTSFMASVLVVFTFFQFSGYYISESEIDSRYIKKTICEKKIDSIYLECEDKLVIVHDTTLIASIINDILKKNDEYRLIVPKENFKVSDMTKMEQLVYYSSKLDVIWGQKLIIESHINGKRIKYLNDSLNIKFEEYKSKHTALKNELE